MRVTRISFRGSGASLDATDHGGKNGTIRSLQVTSRGFHSWCINDQMPTLRCWSEEFSLLEDYEIDLQVSIVQPRKAEPSS